MGQEHVVTILANALAQNRLHHAYLFTGTRGVGKTTIARIFAKSLNCIEGVSAEPCGKCDVCEDIDHGNFVDLLEIDAASRTKVDDTREILENVQYAPSRGRFKVYLIDEVHMLSRSSFNALLKTLEEPPEHVKFILATTDPQKLPITVLSRCLQFHLKALTVNQIERKLKEILVAESVDVDAGSLTLLAKAARGSMRDSLSLTDQAIAQGQGNIQLSNVQQMLGGIDQNWPFKILIALIKHDAEQLMVLSQEIASYAPNYGRLFAELIQLLHQVAMHQVVAHDFNLSNEHLALLKKFAQAMSAEDIQLYYQIALNGRKDLPYAGDEQAAFDMTLLRLLAFKPVAHANELPKNDAARLNDTSTQLAAVSFDDVVLDESNVTIDAPIVNDKVSSPQTAPQLESTDNANSIVIAQDEEESSEAYLEQKLAAEMLSIEQDAENMHSALIASTQTTAELATNENNSAASVQQNQAENIDVEDEPLAGPTEDIQAEPDFFDSTPVEEQPQANDEHSSVVETNSNQNTVTAVTSYNAEPNTQPAAPVVDEPVPTINSPIGDVLKQRNLLRSRKKQQENSGKKSSDADKRQPTVAELQQEKAKDVPNIETIPEQPFAPENIDPAEIKKANQVDKWANMIDAMALNGRLRQLAIQATIDPESNDDLLILCLNQKTKHLKTENAHQQLQEFVSHYFARTMQVEINIVEQTVDDPYQIQTHINDKRYEYAKQVLKDDEIVQQMESKFQAELDESTVVAK